MECLLQPWVWLKPVPTLMAEVVLVRVVPVLVLRTLPTLLEGYVRTVLIVGTRVLTTAPLFPRVPARPRMPVRLLVNTVPILVVLSLALEVRLSTFKKKVFNSASAELSIRNTMLKFTLPSTVPNLAFPRVAAMTVDTVAMTVRLRLLLLTMVLSPENLLLCLPTPPKVPLSTVPKPLTASRPTLCPPIDRRLARRTSMPAS